MHNVKKLESKMRTHEMGMATIFEFGVIAWYLKSAHGCLLAFPRLLVCPLKTTGATFLLVCDE